MTKYIILKEIDDELIKINVCSEKHYFLGESCPFCGKSIIENVEYREGDCIACGQLCPEFAYGCDNPSQIKMGKTFFFDEIEKRYKKALKVDFEFR